MTPSRAGLIVDAELVAGGLLIAGATLRACWRAGAGVRAIAAVGGAFALAASALAVGLVPIHPKVLAACPDVPHLLAHLDVYVAWASLMGVYLCVFARSARPTLVWAIATFLASVHLITFVKVRLGWPFLLAQIDPGDQGSRYGDVIGMEILGQALPGLAVALGAPLLSARGGLGLLLLVLAIPLGFVCGASGMLLVAISFASLVLIAPNVFPKARLRFGNAVQRLFCHPWWAHRLTAGLCAGALALGIVCTVSNHFGTLVLLLQPVIGAILLGGPGARAPWHVGRYLLVTAAFVVAMALAGEKGMGLVMVGIAMAQLLATTGSFASFGVVTLAGGVLGLGVYELSLSRKFVQRTSEWFHAEVTDGGWQSYFAAAMSADGGLLGVGVDASVRATPVAALDKDFVLHAVTFWGGLVVCGVVLVVLMSLVALWISMYTHLQRRTDEQFARPAGVLLLGFVAAFTGCALLNGLGASGALPVVGVPMPGLSFGRIPMLMLAVAGAFTLLIGQEEGERP